MSIFILKIGVSTLFSSIKRLPSDQPFRRQPLLSQYPLQGLLQLVKVPRGLKVSNELPVLVQQTNRKAVRNRFRFLGVLVDEERLISQVSVHRVGVHTVDLDFLEQGKLDPVLLCHMGLDLVVVLRLAVSELVARERHDFKPVFPVLGVDFVQHVVVLFCQTAVTSNIHQQKSTSVFVYIEVNSATRNVVGLEVEEVLGLFRVDCFLVGFKAYHSHGYSNCQEINFSL